jgi:hypothetical protein
MYATVFPLLNNHPYHIFGLKTVYAFYAFGLLRGRSCLSTRHMCPEPRPVAVTVGTDIFRSTRPRLRFHRHRQHRSSAPWDIPSVCGCTWSYLRCRSTIGASLGCSQIHSLRAEHALHSRERGRSPNRLLHEGSPDSMMTSHHGATRLRSHKSAWTSLSRSSRYLTTLSSSLDPIISLAYLFSSGVALATATAQSAV